RGDGDVEEPFEGELRLVRRRRGKGQERDSFQLLDLDPGHAVLEEVHGYAGADAELLAVEEDLLHLVELLPRHGEDDLVDRLGLQPPLEQRAQLRHGAEDTVARPPVREAVAVGDEAEDLVAPVLVALDDARHFDGAAASADDEDGAVVEAIEADVARDHAHGDLLDDQEERGEDAEEDEPGAGELAEG